MTTVNIELFDMIFGLVVFIIGFYCGYGLKSFLSEEEDDE